MTAAGISTQVILEVKSLFESTTLHSFATTQQLSRDLRDTEQLLTWPGRPMSEIEVFPSLKAAEYKSKILSLVIQCLTSGTVWHFALTALCDFDSFVLAYAAQNFWSRS